MRRTTAPLLVVILLVSGVTTRLRALECINCIPETLNQNFGGWSGEISVCIDTDDFSENQANWMEAAIESYWEPWVEGNNTGITINVTQNGDCSSAAVKVRSSGDPPDPACQSQGACAGPTEGIWVNPSLGPPATNEDRWKYTAGHEFGHVLNLAHPQNSGCGDFSLMNSQPPSPPQLPSSMKCADMSGMTKWYLGGNTQSGGYSYEWSQDYEDCYDIYLVTEYFYRVEGQMSFIGYTAVKVGWTCDEQY